MPDQAEFTRRTEPFRRELMAHCYRMLGSVDEAEDLVQETYLRAWRAYQGFEGRSSLRVWLYRIATNACLNARRQRARRPLPTELGDSAPSGAEGIDVPWLQPVPDALVSADPETIVTSRESLRLALIASLQHLPARQRAVLILRDVLAWPAAEVAETLDTTTAAVKSSLQRARARLEQVAPSPTEVIEPTEPEARAQLDRYIAAFENADAVALEKLLREDATLEATPFPNRFAGKEACLRIIRQELGSPGTWQMVPTTANGQPAAVGYRRGEDGAHHAFGVLVLTATTSGVARIVVFADPDLVARFGLPPIRR